ncbi:hypothetical protein GCM10027589_47780 [Actinocorallia lasiicapitis]
MRGRGQRVLTDGRAGSTGTGTFLRLEGGWETSLILGPKLKGSPERPAEVSDHDRGECHR